MLPTPEAPEIRPATEEPEQLSIRVNDIDLTYFEWHGDGRTIVLAHATGFHARVWDEVARLLPDYHVLALDLRGHGRTAADGPLRSWYPFGQDIAAFMHELDLQGALGVGHSMGGHSITHAAAIAPDAFAGLLLVDPVIFLDGPPRRTRGDSAEFVRRRRNQWESPEEMVGRFRDREPYSLWRAAALEAYARWGLLPNPEGEGHVLACSPDFEADIYALAGHGPDMQNDVIPKITVPVTVLRVLPPDPSTPTVAFTASPTPPDLAGAFADAIDVLEPALSHFIPMQAPEVVAAQVHALAERLS